MPIQQNGVKPGEEPALPVVTAQTFPRFHEGILREVFGQGGVAAKRHGLSQQAGFMDAANLTERFGIAGQSPVEQTLRVWNFDFHERWTQAGHTSVIIQKSGQFHRGTVRLAVWQAANHGDKASPILFPDM
jgi:hypothetical protein